MQNNVPLDDFVEGIVGTSHVRIEEDYGNGFVKLCSSEAERRQAVQDIRSTEDIVIEMLRNSRDAHAKHIFCAMQREGNLRTIIMIDDGDGIPEELQDMVFEPRVTSKLDTAHLDRWGMHGRGMALFSVSVNTEAAYVKRSEVGLGTSIKIVSNTDELPEKADQSTFPYFELGAGSASMRGPRNILRTVAEFAIECRDDVKVYCGSPTEILSTMHSIGSESIPSSVRLFKREPSSDVKLTELPALASDPEELVRIAASLGIEISTRSARRIFDGDIHPLPSMLERIERESFTRSGDADHGSEDLQALPSSKPKDAPSALRTRFSKEDLESIKPALERIYSELASRYYLADSPPDIRQTGDTLIIEFKVEEQI